MKLKTKLFKIPVFGTLGKAVVNYWRSKSDEKILKSLGSVSHPVAKNLNKVLLDLKKRDISVEKEWDNRIENERKRLLNNHAPLVDGSKENEGLYDGDKTIEKACQASRDSYSALFLYLLTRSLQPKNVIELGTNVGISSAYIAAAIKGSGTGGQLITLDASPYRLKLAREVHRKVGLENIEYEQGLFYKTLEPALEKMGGIDLAFIDGHHQYQPTLDYFEKIINRAVPGAVIIFDDIRYSEGMKKAWGELQNDQRFDLVVDLKNIGVCCVQSKTNGSQRFVSPAIHNALKNSQ